MNAIAPTAWRSAVALALIALLAAGLLAGMHAWTRDEIAAAERRTQREALAIVLPPSSYDNDPILDSVQVTAPAWLGGRDDLAVRRAKRDGHARALVLQAIAPDGYGGPIALLVGVDDAGRITGVRVTAHHETPGLGDAIDFQRSPWIARFAGRFLGDPPEAGWTVKSEGGDFDQFAGATLTPRAVVKAVHRVLEFVRKHGREIENAPAGSALHFDDAPEAPLPATGAAP